MDNFPDINKKSLVNILTLRYDPSIIPKLVPKTPDNFIENERIEESLNLTDRKLHGGTGQVGTGKKDIGDFDNNDLDFSQKHLRIVSGLYGILKHLDLIQPYRLEMGTKLKTEKGKNLYHFWRNLLTAYMKKEIQENKDNYLVNLASDEYSKAIDINKLRVPCVTPVFKDFKNGKLKVISFFAKNPITFN